MCMQHMTPTELYVFSTFVLVVVFIQTYTHFTNM